jgi:CDP-diglyceride synthetase
MTYMDFLTNWEEALVGGATGALVATLGIMFILFVAAVYIYQAWAWMTIAKKQKHKYPWLAWIPFAGDAMRLQLGKFHWAWVFLWVVPIFGWLALVILLTMAQWRIFEKEKYEGWFALSYPVMLLPRISEVGFVAYLIIIGFVAWRNPKKNSRKK